MQNDSYPEPPEYREVPPTPPPVQQQPPAVTPLPPVKPANAFPRVMEIVGIIVLVLLAVVGGYMLRDQTGKHAVVSAPVQSPNTAPHFVSTTGAPLGTTSTVTTKLGFPADLEAVQSPTSAAHPGILNYFSSQMSDEMGRWTIGDPTSTTNQPLGDITLINLNRQTWYVLPVPTTPPPFKGTEPGAELLTANTPYAKASAIDSYAKRIQTCAQDPATGAVISGFMSICVTPEIISSSKTNFHSQALIEGYGKSGTVELLLLGAIELETGNNQTQAQQKKLADAYTHGTKPSYFAAETKAIRSALAASNISVTSTQ